MYFLLKFWEGRVGLILKMPKPISELGDIKERDSMFSANLGRHKNKNAEKSHLKNVS